jgi:plasmid stabilization system protein ParE
MIYHVIVQPTAFQEIEASYRWICDNLTPDIANNWYYELEDAIASLQKFPRRCKIVPESDVIGREIRQLWVGKQRKYRVLFVVEESVVSILHVRHARQSYLTD